MLEKITFLTKKGEIKVHFLQENAVKLTSHTEPTQQFASLKETLPKLLAENEDRETEYVLRKDLEGVRIEMSIQPDNGYKGYEWRGFCYHNVEWITQNTYKLTGKDKLTWDEDKPFYATLEEALLDFDTRSQKLIAEVKKGKTRDKPYEPTL
jgi:hypothetical protein